MKIVPTVSMLWGLVLCCGLAAASPSAALRGPGAGGAPDEEQANQPASQIGGDWEVSIVTGTEVIDGTLELDLDGQAVQGTWMRSDEPGVASEPVAGRINETTVELGFIVEISEVRDQVSFVGQVNGAGRDAMIAGTFTTADGTTGEWTARRP